LKYTNFGHKVHRGGTGFVNDRWSILDPHSEHTLQRWAKRMEHITAEFLPSKLLRGISKANGLSAWPTTGKCIISRSCRKIIVTLSTNS
jgi:hypothetical protein